MSMVSPALKLRIGEGGWYIPNVVALTCCNFEVQCGALKG